MSLNHLRVFFLLGFFLMISACTTEQKPQLIIYGKDVCENCHMVISDQRFGAQIVTKKGKLHLFDSVNCLHNYLKTHPESSQKIFFVDAIHKDQWISSEEAFFVNISTLRSPMGAGIIAVHAIGELAQLPGYNEMVKALSLQGSMKWEQLSAELSAGKFK